LKKDHHGSSKRTRRCKFFSVDSRTPH
jgi:hypothetical protein